jgi:hypothetical protein
MTKINIKNKINNTNILKNKIKKVLNNRLRYKINRKKNKNIKTNKMKVNKKKLHKKIR